MKIENNVSLKQYNTLQIPVNAKYFTIIKNEDELFDLIQNPIRKNENHCILGGGANILFTKDFEGIIVKNEILGKEIMQRNEKSVIVEVGAGENRSDFVIWSCDNGFYGIENLIDIPGNVGTAPVSNIGAYGTEISDLIYEVEGVNLTNYEKNVYKKSECGFSYRSSIFKRDLQQNFIVTKVRFELKILDNNYVPNIAYADIQRYMTEKNITPKMPRDVSNIVSDIRFNKLPDWHKIGTAGSFFSNPIVLDSQRNNLEIKYPNLVHHQYDDGTGIIKYKLSAGQLIDLCGLKGWRIENGKSGTYEKHALILINEGGTSEDVLVAMKYIQKSVFDKFGVMLEPEVVFV